jgi:cytochrome c-type biogenesis protein CcmH
MKTLLAILLLAFTLAVPAYAVEPRERLADPVMEARAREISKGLRCLVCRNESIDESGADLAHDVRIMLRERLVAGDTDAQAVQAIVDRYGDFVLLNPPLMRATYVLWFAPPTLLAVAGLSIFFAVRRQRKAAGGGAAPLNETERQRLAQLMQENDL